MTRVQVYLPSEMSGFDGCKDYAREKMAKRFGGVAVTEGEGSWYHDGEIQTEPVIILTTFTNDGKVKCKQYLTYEILSYLHGYNLYDERCLMGTVNNEQILYPEP